MSGLSVKVDLAGAVRDATAAFEAFWVSRFRRANISYTGFGKLSAKDAKSIALKAAARYQRNTAGTTRGSAT